MRTALLLLALLLARCSAQPKPLIDRSIRVDSLSAAADAFFSLEPNTAFRIHVLLLGNATEASYLHVQYVTNPRNSTRRVALVASRQPTEQHNWPAGQPAVLVNGKTSGLQSRECSEKLPCLVGEFKDEQSLFTAPGAAFVRMPVVKAKLSVAVLLKWIPNEDGGPPLKGKVAVRASKEKRCGSRTNNKQCAGDKCNEGECVCKGGRRGRFCEVEKKRVFLWRDLVKKRSCNALMESEEATVPIRSLQWHYVEYEQCAKKLGTKDDQGIEATVEIAPNLVTVVAKIPGQVCNDNILSKGEDLPSMYDNKTDCAARLDGNNQYVYAKKVKASDKWIIGLLPSANAISNGDFKVKIRIHKCFTKGNGPNTCAFRPRQSQMYAFLILPICLCILCIAAAIVCILLYIDRRHGLVTGPDKLSRKELQLMCPEYQLAGPAIEQPDHAEHIACNICISDFQPGDKLRKLRCDHRFHCDCVDPWLTEANASCPTCRQEARVDELSERRIQRAIVKHVLAPMLRLPQRTRRRGARLAGVSSMRRSGSLTDLAGARAVAARARAERTATASERAFSERPVSDPGGSGVFGSDDVPPAPTPPHTQNDRKIVPPGAPTGRASSHHSTDIASDDASDGVPLAPTPPQPFPRARPDRARVPGHSTRAPVFDPGLDIMPNRGSPRSSLRNSRRDEQRPASPSSDSTSTTSTSATSTTTPTTGRHPSEFSENSFYTAPLNFDFTPLVDHGLLPHVRAGLVPPRNAPTVPTRPDRSADTSNPSASTTRRR